MSSSDSRPSFPNPPVEIANPASPLESLEELWLFDSDSGDENSDRVVAVDNNVYPRSSTPLQSFDRFSNSDEENLDPKKRAVWQKKKANFKKLLANDGFDMDLDFDVITSIAKSEVNSYVDILSRFAVEEHNRIEDDHLEFVKTLKVLRSIDGGFLDFLTFEAKDQNRNLGIYQARVWCSFKPQNHLELFRVAPDNFDTSPWRRPDVVSDDSDVNSDESDVDYDYPVELPKDMIRQVEIRDDLGDPCEG